MTKLQQARQILQNPNPFQSWEVLQLNLDMDFNLFGSCFVWIIDDAQGNPKECVALSPLQVSVEKDKKGNVVRWILDNGKVINPSNIIKDPE